MLYVVAPLYVVCWPGLQDPRSTPRRRPHNASLPCRRQAQAGLPWIARVCYNTSWGSEANCTGTTIVVLDDEGSKVADSHHYAYGEERWRGGNDMVARQAAFPYLWVSGAGLHCGLVALRKAVLAINLHASDVAHVICRFRGQHHGKRIQN